MTIRNIVEFSELGEDIQDLESLKFSLNQTINELNFIISRLAISNFDGEIASASIPANSTAEIPHKLGVIPKYKILLKQIGGGSSIEDVSFGKSSIILKNNGASTAEVTILIAKD